MFVILSEPQYIYGIGFLSAIDSYSVVMECEGSLLYSQTLTVLSNIFPMFSIPLDNRS
jgi:hypothetical protein